MVKRDIEKELVPYCISNGTGIIAYSPLERGLLTGKMKPGHHFGEGDHRAKLFYFNKENLLRTAAFLDAIHPIAAEKGISLSQLVLLWTLEQPGISITLVGARNAEQAIQNAKAVEASISADEVDRISSELAQLQLVKP